MKKILLIVLLASSISFPGCKSGANDEPKTVLQNFIEALGKKDIKEAKKFATADTQPWLDNLAKVFDTTKNKDMKMTVKYDNANMEYGDTKIDGDKASIPVKDKVSGLVTDFPLKKEGNAWKVDMAAMMQDAIGDRMNLKDLNDSLSTNIDKMNNVNIDSFADEMNKNMKNMKGVDSLIKSMKMH